MNFDFYSNDYQDYNHRLPSCLHNQVISYFISRTKNADYFLRENFNENFILNNCPQIEESFDSNSFKKMARHNFIIYFVDYNEERQK